MGQLEGQNVPSKATLAVLETNNKTIVYIKIYSRYLEYFCVRRLTAQSSTIVLSVQAS